MIDRLKKKKNTIKYRDAIYGNCGKQQDDIENL